MTTIGKYLLGSLLVLAFGINTSDGQTTGNYKIAQFVLDSGGGQQRSMASTLFHSTGQPLITHSSNARYVKAAGFYASFCPVLKQTPGSPQPTPTTPIVPEPSTLALVVAGLFGLGTFLWRKGRYSNPQ